MFEYIGIAMIALGIVVLIIAFVGYKEIIHVPHPAPDIPPERQCICCICQDLDEKDYDEFEQLMHDGDLYNV